MSSRNLEENVVKMRFDNSEFDSNIEQSNNTLDKFKNTITTLPQNIYIGISNALSRINLADVIGIASTLAGIQLVRNGIIGIGTELRNVATSALRTINNIFTSAINQINEGGKARAMNIANAKFQIEGLKLDVDTFMEAADYAVSGTAYGLDAAAKVASQLGASGVTELEELKKALRGVSGVAAMTNASYEEIGHLFTVIASNGRLMTEQIRSFSARGLNISSELAKSLNKTEAEISEMVRKGEIDFKRFYTAMDEAFGEHAKDANKTFTGAMSNVRAALSRIGEGIWTPILDNAIGVFNQLRLAINAFNASLKDVDGENSFTTFANTIKNVFDRVAYMIELIRHVIESTDYFDEIGGLFMALQRLANDIANAFSIDYVFVMQQIIDNFTDIINIIKRCTNALGDFFKEDNKLRKFGGTVQSLFLWITSFADRFLNIFNERENSVFETIESWSKALKSVFDTIKDILGINRKNIEGLFDGAVNAVFDLIENLKLSDDRINKITRTFRGAASVLDIIKMAVSAIFNFIKPIFNYIPTAVDGILTVSAAIGDWLYNIRNLIKEGELFENIFDSIKGICIFIKDLIGNIGSNFFEVFFGEGSKDKTFLSKIKDFIKLIGETVSEAFNNLNIEGLDFGPIQEFINNLANFGVTSGDTSKAETILDHLSGFFGKIKEGFGKIGEFFQSHIFNIFTGENETFNKFTDFVGDLGDKFGGFLTAISDFLNNTAIPEAEAIAIVALIWKAMDCIKDIAIAFIQGFVELASIIANDFNGKDLIVPIVEKIVDKFLGSKTEGIFDKIKNFFGLLKELDLPSIFHGRSEPEEATILRAIGEALKGFAWAFVGIAAALFIIALIPTDRLEPAVNALFKFVLLISIVSAALLILNRVLPNFNTGIIRFLNANASFLPNTTANPLSAVGYAFQTIGIGLLAIAASLYVIAKIDNTNGQLDNAVDVIVGFTIIISLILTAFVLLSKRMADGGQTLNNVGKSIRRVGVGLLAISIGLAILASAIKPEDSGKLLAVSAALGAMLLAAGALIAFVTKISANAGTAAIASLMIFTTLGTIAALILVLAGSLIALSYIDADKLSTVAWVMGGLVTAILGMLSVLMIAANAAASPQALAALGIAAGILLALCTDLLAIGFIIAEVARVITAISAMVTGLRDMLEMFKNMEDTDAERIVTNIAKILIGVAGAISMAFEEYYRQSMNSIKRLFPKILTFVSKELLPFIDNLFGIVIPSLISKTIDSVNTTLLALIAYFPEAMGMLDKLLFGAAGIIVYIQIMLDKIWDDTISWINRRIEIWIKDILIILLKIVKAINAAFEGDWEEFDKEIQDLIDHTINFVKDLLTNDKTTKDLTDLVDGIFSRISEIVRENKDAIREAFGDLGKVIGSSILGGIADTMPDNALGNMLNSMLNDAADSIDPDLTFTGLSPLGGTNGFPQYSTGFNTDVANIDVVGSMFTNTNTNTNTDNASKFKDFRDSRSSKDKDLSLELIFSPDWYRFNKGTQAYNKNQMHSGVKLKNG